MYKHNDSVHICYSIYYQNYAFSCSSKKVKKIKNEPLYVRKGDFFRLSLLFSCSFQEIVQLLSIFFIYDSHLVPVKTISH